MRLLALTLLGFALLAAQGDKGKKPDRVVSIVAERFTFNPSSITLKQG